MGLASCRSLSPSIAFFMEAARQLLSAAARPSLSSFASLVLPGTVFFRRTFFAWIIVVFPSRLLKFDNPSSGLDRSMKRSLV